MSRPGGPGKVVHWPGALSAIQQLHHTMQGSSSSMAQAAVSVLQLQDEISEVMLFGHKGGRWQHDCTPCPERRLHVCPRPSPICCRRRCWVDLGSAGQLSVSQGADLFNSTSRPAEGSSGRSGCCGRHESTVRGRRLCTGDRVAASCNLDASC